MYRGRQAGCTWVLHHSRGHDRWDTKSGIQLEWEAQTIHFTFTFCVHFSAFFLKRPTITTVQSSDIFSKASYIPTKSLVKTYLSVRQDRGRSHSDLPIPLRWSSSTPAWWRSWPERCRRTRCRRGSGSTPSSRPSPLEQLQRRTMAHERKHKCWCAKTIILVF